MPAILDFSKTDFHSIAAYTVVIFMLALTGFIIVTATVLTVIRVCYSLKKQEKAFGSNQDQGPEDMTAENTVGGLKSFIKFLRRDKDYEMVTVIKGVMGNYSQIGVRVEGGIDNPTIPGDPGIFIRGVKQNSPAEGKLYPGDRVLSVNGERVTRVPLRYAEQMIKNAEGVVKFYVKRAPKRLRRIYIALDECSKDRNSVFAKQQIEEIEDGFSVYDRAFKGSIKTADVFPLVRSLGHNLQEAEIWVYMNELGYIANPKVSLKEFIRLMNLIVTEHESYEEHIEFAFSVYDTENQGFISVQDLQQSFDRLPERQKIQDQELDEIKRFGDKDRDGKLEFRDFRRLMLPVMKMY